MMRSLNFLVWPCLVFLVFLSSCGPEEVDPDTQFVRDLEAIDAHLSINGISAYKDITGIRFSINSIGTGGLPPRHDQQVKVKYKGRLLDGTAFDEGTTTNYVGAYIGGWQRSLPLLPKGTVATIFIPSELGYGTQGNRSIPPNSVLVFDIELQDVIQSAAEKLRAPTDVAAIDKYLSDNGITAVADTTGLRYVITQEGSGEKPSWFTKVKFNYTGKVLNGEQFTTGTTEPSEVLDSRVVDYIQGVLISLTKLSPGGKGTFYIPSGLAFGANESGSAPVPPNTNIVYEIELVQFYPE
jgi:FKBP-type peptidyl-prolyl cis-trans isomerase FkpA